MADEYIEREAVIELLEEKQREICPAGRCGHGYVYGRDRDEYDAIESDIDAVQNIRAADVAPVVRGQWILHDEVTDWDETWECSACGEEFDMIEGTPMDNGYNFCPNCGADMREVSHDN